MFNQFKRLIIGQPKNRELKDEKISKFKGLAILRRMHYLQWLTVPNKY